LHGYAIAVKLVFEAEDLDSRNWVVDFGGLKEVKKWLQEKFDHKLLVAEDDPLISYFLGLHKVGGADVVVVERVGCEAFAEMVFVYIDQWLNVQNYTPRVRLASVEVAEHGANSAVYF
jgi:6-pyruvoyltetrahydropterin/6-carboxytetrahydropterin synthase